MIVYRIERSKYLSQTLSGRGAALATSNRWNSRHTPMIYTSEHRSLAMLEMAVHMNLNTHLPSDRLIVEIEIPDEIDIAVIEEKDLPRGWDNKPPSKSTQLIGDYFISDRSYLAVKVPSAIIKREYNVLINPLHQDMDSVYVRASEPFRFDDRLG